MQLKYLRQNEVSTPRKHSNAAFSLPPPFAFSAPSFPPKNLARKYCYIVYFHTALNVEGTLQGISNFLWHF